MRRVAAYFLVVLLLLSPVGVFAAKSDIDHGKGKRTKVKAIKDFKGKNRDVIPPVDSPPARFTPDGSRGAVNPTAPNSQTQTLSGDFTDTDGDGMTDEAEIKYGFDPNDSNSFPTEPALVTIPNYPIPASEIGATYDVEARKITIRWINPSPNNYILRLMDGSRQLYYGGHYDDHAPVDFDDYGLTGAETLTGNFLLYDSKGQWLHSYPTFSINLGDTPTQVHLPANRTSYTFQDFPSDREAQYREFLKRLMPILYYYLGPPAESFNVVIKNMGQDTGYFITTDNGRTLLTDTEFIPRLIAHEFVHIWKGKYVFSSDAHWEYAEELNGFEEATAEGMAFEMMHEYVRSYPGDPAALQLLNYKPYQYWASETTHLDSIKTLRSMISGSFWDAPGLEYDKYSIAATVFQYMRKQNPDAYKDIANLYFDRINSQPFWRPNRADLISMWGQAVPAVNRIPLDRFLSTIPVFDGKFYDEGMYVLGGIRQYGWGGDHQYAATYADKDGKAWWGVLQSQLSSYALPPWISWMHSTPPDSYVYINTQGEPFTVELFDSHNASTKTFFDTTNTLNGGLGYGWKMVYPLDAENFPTGLYRETIAFTGYVPYDDNAREDRYFFGVNGLNQNRNAEYVIMVGVDGVQGGTVKINISGADYTSAIINGAAVFRSTEWPFDMEGEIPITVTDESGVSRTYYRSVIEAGTYHDYYQTQFIIIDKDFDGTEDSVQMATTGLSTTSQNFGEQGGSGNFRYVPSDNDPWTVRSNDSWITFLSRTTGTGRSTIYYRVDPGSPTDSRIGTVMINNTVVQVFQRGSNDTVPPPLTLDPVTTPTRLTSQTITGTTDQNAAVHVSCGTPTCSGMATRSSTTWSFTLNGLVEGTNTLTITAKDGSGNITTLTETVTVDTVSPALSVNSVTSPTRANSQILSGTVEDGAAVHVQADTTASSGYASVNGNSWTYTISGLADGVNHISVSAADPAGNVTTVNATIFVDRIPPALTLNPVSTPTRSNSQTLLGTVEEGAAVYVQTDTAASGGYAAVTGTTWQYTITGLVSGSNNITVTATDAAANTTVRTASITKKGK